MTRLSGGQGAETRDWGVFQFEGGGICSGPTVLDVRSLSPYVIGVIPS